MHTVFPVIRAPSAYLISKLLGVALIRELRSNEGGANFKVRKMNDIFQNFVDVSFKKQNFTNNKSRK